MPAMSRPFLAVWALLASCVPLSGGSDSGAPGCPDIACGPAYQIGFQRPGTWTAGTYRVDVTADGMANSCEIVIPMSCDHPPRCQGNPGWLPILVGCALDPAQQKIDGIVFDRAMPASVTVAVSMGDRSLGLRTFNPMYRTSTGPAACNLSCTQAPTETLTLSQ
jgi:hypothetical protein